MKVFHINLLTGLGFFAGSIYVIWEARNLEYYTPLGPGGGFFPFWLGAVMAGITLGWLVQEIKNKDNRNSLFLAKDADIARVILPIIALLAVSVFMNIIGFQLTIFLFLIFLIKFLGRQSFSISLTVAFLGSFGVYYVFTRFLDIILPTAAIKFLANLGL